MLVKFFNRSNKDIVLLINDSEVMELQKGYFKELEVHELYYDRLFYRNKEEQEKREFIKEEGNVLNVF